MAAKNYKKWLSNPQTWLLRAKFHKENKLHILAADSYLTSFRLGMDDNIDAYVDCCICLRRMLEKQSGLEIMIRAYRLKPYDPLIRAKLCIYSAECEQMLVIKIHRLLKSKRLFVACFIA